MADDCPFCGGEVVQPTGGGRPRIWCSDTCRKTRWRVIDAVTGQRRYETPAETRARMTASRKRRDQLNREFGDMT